MDIDIQWEKPGEFYKETTGDMIPRVGDSVSFGPDSFRVHHVAWMFDLEMEDWEPLVRVVLR
jgi:hypothetical protein